jgi:hypothetical protein
MLSTLFKNVEEYLRRLFTIDGSGFYTITDVHTLELSEHIQIIDKDNEQTEPLQIIDYDMDSKRVLDEDFDFVRCVAIEEVS